jgi:hypothetical protein
MSLLQLLILGVGAMGALMVSRLVLDHFDRSPHPEGFRRLLVLVAFLFLPTIAFGALIDPSAGPMRAIATVPLYALVLLGIFLLMWLAAQVARQVVRGRARPLVLLALVGNRGEHDEIPYDPPVTRKLAASIALVDRTNAVFPRGPEFPTQVERRGFQSDWDALDAATQSLEAGIADDRRIGLPVASGAVATAFDARNRLDTLKRLAGGRFSGAALGSSAPAG